MRRTAGGVRCRRGRVRDTRSNAPKPTCLAAALSVVYLTTDALTSDMVNDLLEDKNIRRESPRQRLVVRI